MVDKYSKEIRSTVTSDGNVELSIVTVDTPTPADDVFVGKLYKILDWFAINVGKAKEQAK